MFFLAFDERQMPRSDLVRIVSRLVFEDGVQGDVVIRVDRSGVFRFASTDGKVDLAVMPVEVFLALADERRDGGVIAVFESEEDLMCEFGHAWSVVFEWFGNGALPSDFDGIDHPFGRV